MTVQYNDINISENISIRVEDGPITNANSSKTVNRKWYLIKDAAGTSNLTLTATYNSGEEGSGFSNSSCPQIGYFDGNSWAYHPITSGSGTTTFTAPGFSTDFTNTSGFFVLGSGDAFNATKLVVTNINPANPSLGAANTFITIQSQNSNNIPTLVSSATGFSITGSNTTMLTSPTGTIAQNTYQTVVPSIAFTTSTFNTSTSAYNHNATLTATRTSGDVLTSVSSSDFDVYLAIIYKPKTTGNTWSAVTWTRSIDGGQTFSDTTNLRTVFSSLQIIIIPEGYYSYCQCISFFLFHAHLWHFGY